MKDALRDNYNTIKVMDFLRAQIKGAGFSHADIAKTPTGTNITVHVTKPGIVIGRKGAGIRELTDTLARDFGLKDPRLSVTEIPVPELSPSVMCGRIASHIERGTAFRRAIMWTMRQIMAAGAKGVQITASGKLRGDRSAFEKHTQGVLPRAGHFADIIVDEDVEHVQTPMGLIGIRIRIAKKDRYDGLRSFELRTPKESASASIARAGERDIDPKSAEPASAEARAEPAARAGEGGGVQP